MSHRARGRVGPAELGDGKGEGVDLVSEGKGKALEEAERIRKDAPRELLFAAIGRGDRDLAAERMGRCDLEAADGNGNTALLWACAHGEREIARDLLDRGADLTARNAGGWGAMLCAAANGRAEIIEELLSRGLDPRGAKDGGVSAGALAAARGFAGALEALWRGGWRWQEEESREGWRPESEALLENLEIAKSAAESGRPGARRGL